MFRSEFLSSVVTALAILHQASLGQLVEYDYTMIDFPGASETAAYGINNLGHIVGEYGNIDFSSSSNEGNKGFIYDGSQYQTIDVPGSVSTVASGLNDSGLIVGEYRLPSGTVRGFLFDGVNYTDIVTPWANDAAATDINNAGVIVGTFSADGFQNDAHGFTLNGGAYSEFNFPGASSTFFSGINNEDEKVGTFFSTAQAAGFLLPGSQQINHPSGIVTEATGINDVGAIVGRYAIILPSIDGRFEGFLFDSATMTYSNIDLPGSDVCGFPLLGTPTQCLRSVTGINSAGTIVGWNDNDDGAYHGFVGRLPLSNSADFDEDGDVDGDDFLAWQGGFGTQSGAQKSDGDYENDGDVDGDDFLGWQSEFGSGSAAAVPEPASVTLLPLFVAPVILRRYVRIGLPPR